MSGKKKFVIKPFRPQNQWNRQKAEATLAALRKAIQEIHNQNASLLSFEELYRNSYNLVLNKYGEMLYKGVHDQVSEHLASQHCQGQVISASDDMLLSKLNEQWETHILNMVMIRDILMYMDRTWVNQQKKTKVYDMVTSKSTRRPALTIRSKRKLSIVAQKVSKRM